MGFRLATDAERVRWLHRPEGPERLYLMQSPAGDAVVATGGLGPQLLHCTVPAAQTREFAEVVTFMAELPYGGRTPEEDHVAARGAWG